MGKAISRGCEVDRKDRAGISLRDKVWLERWLAKYHHGAVMLLNEMNKEDLEHVIKLLDIEDVQNPHDVGSATGFVDD